MPKSILPSGAYLRRFFGLNRREARGYSILFIIMMLSLSAPWFIRKCNDVPISLSEAEIQTLDSLYDLLTGNMDPVHPMFSFDPNLLSEDSLELLGIPSQLALRIARYRSSGGRFREAGDLLKIYGMDSSLFFKLEPWLRIGSSGLASVPGSATASLMDINTVQYRQLVEQIELKPELAGRVIRYREVLGGFVDTGQLKEVYGMDTAGLDILMRSLRVSEDFVPKKIHINSDAVQEMQGHPYISRELAASIVLFREINGRIRDEKELSGFVSLTSGDLEKLLPYIQF